MSKIDEPNAMELAPIAEARMIFERQLKEHLSRMQSRACTSYAEAMVFFEALASKIDEPNAMELAPIAEARMIFER